MTIRSRIERLEARTMAKDMALDLWVCRVFVSPEPDAGDDGLTRIECGEQAWRRNEHETEDEFKARAKAECTKDPPRVFRCSY